MKLLFLADTQTDRNNLEDSERMIRHLLRIADKEQPDYIVHCGDAKDQYDPIPLMVVKFWVRSIKKIVSRGHRLLILKGNHDRISQSIESQDWLDILASAGATIINKPKIIDDIAFLPYTPNKKQEIEWADELSETPAKVMVFHTAVAEGVGDNGITGLGNTTSTLHFHKYTACFGGHYHKPQKIGDNAWYVGSPFCHSWGEVNQPKGFLMATIKDTIKIKWIMSKIPRWYDASYLESRGIQPEDNAYIRSRVPVTTKKILVDLRKEEERLKLLYPKARLYVTPQVIHSGGEAEVLTGQTDREKVEQYVSQTYPEGARFKPAQVTSYLSSLLREAGHSSSNRQIRLRSVYGRNALCFEEVEVPLDGQGLIFIEGENRDWKGRSNGSGKTSLLNLIPIALYGKNLKGQTHDAWARENTDKTARITLKFTDYKNREVEVERTRRPHGIFLRINGTDVSTGLKGTTKNETQGEIEKLYADYQTLINSTYVDQTVANSFLYGTQKDRMDLMSKIVSMERFEYGLKKISQELQRITQKANDCSNNVLIAEDKLQSVQQQIDELDQLIETNWDKQKKKAYEELEAVQKEYTAVAAVSQTYTELQEEVDEAYSELQNFNNKQAGLKMQLALTLKAKNKAAEQAKNKICPTCGQPIAAKVGWAEVEKLAEECSTFQKSIHKISTAKESMAEKIGLKVKKLEKYKAKLADLTTELQLARKSYELAEEGAKSEAIKNQQIAEKKSLYQLELIQHQLELRLLHRIAKRLDIDIEMLEYAKKAFQRNGMPLMLCRSVCQVLNVAAEYYAELFFESQQGVKFSANTDEFKVEVINGVGSQTVAGQSTGEGSMAGCIAALALREACPKTNVLILDEPGHGLDTLGAKAFARGLIQLKKNFSTILVTTHSTAIAAELSGENNWKVIKEGGVSRLQK